MDLALISKKNTVAIGYQTKAIETNKFKKNAI